MLAIEKVPDSIASVCSKLKRLKIQESLLVKNISTNIPHECLEDFEHNIFIQNAGDGITEKNLKEMWILFCDLKSRSESENLDDSDMIELKSDVLALDTKIKNIKASLRVELSNVIEYEKEILTKMNQEMQPDNYEKKVRVQSFDNIVPSPVKLYRETPMKHDLPYKADLYSRSQAVKEFDNFIQKHKKYDGWVEYNHNIFVQLWEKYCGIVESKATADTAEIDNIFKSNRFRKFQKELVNQVQGMMLSEKDIIEHGKWYIQFCCLKNQKKEAIANWQAKRNVYQSSFTNDSNIATKKKTILSNNHDSKLYFNNYETIHSRTEIKTDGKSATPTKTFSTDSLQRIQRPTKQWLSKCNDEEDDCSFGSFCEVDNLQKVKEPQWRTSLRNIT